MALAYIVTLEKEIPELAAYTKGKTGKALARETDKLDYAARSAKCAAITSMVSENPEALKAQLLADGFDPSRMRLPPEQWFAAGDGLKAARTLSDYVAANLNNFKQPNPILRDLKAVAELLAGAEKAGVKFHFTKGEL